MKKYISYLDNNAAHARPYKFYVFEKSPDYELLLESLKHLSTLIPEITGNLEKDKTGRTYIHCHKGRVFLDEEKKSENIGDYNSLNIIDDHKDELLNNENDTLEGPVFSAKLTTYKCGSGILGVQWCHGLCDETGYMQLMTRWASICRGVRSFEELDRSRDISFAIGKNDKPDNLDYAILDESLAKEIDKKINPNLEQSRYAIFKITEEKINHLNAIKKLNHETNISTQDLLTALIWRNIAKNQEGDSSTLLEVLNFRNRIHQKIGPQYFGNALTFTYKKISRKKIMEGSLASTALLIREGKQEGLEEHKIISEILKCKSLQEKNMHLPCFYKRLLDLEDNTIIMNNLSKIPIHEIDFGTGTPKWIGGLRKNVTRHFCLYPIPSHSGASLMLHLTLPNSEMQKFIDNTDLGYFF